jgi:hypothetical protein
MDFFGIHITFFLLIIGLFQLSMELFPESYHSKMNCLNILISSRDGTGRGSVFFVEFYYIRTIL